MDVNEREEDDDVPPQLVDAGVDSRNTALSSTSLATAPDDLSFVKVPITIVTGKQPGGRISVHASARKKSSSLVLQALAALKRFGPDARRVVLGQDVEN